MKNKIAALTTTAMLFLASAASAEVVIGVILPLSGVNAQGGEDLRRGMEIALKEVNDRGGVQGEPLRIIYEDSGDSPQRAIDAARKLVSVDGVALVVGEYSSGITIPLGGIVKLFPGIESGGALPSVTRPCFSHSRSSARTRRRGSDGIWRQSFCGGEGGTGSRFHRGSRGTFAPALPI